MERLTALQAELSKNQDANKELQSKAQQLEKRLQEESQARQEIQQQLIAITRQKEQVDCTD